MVTELYDVLRQIGCDEARARAAANEMQPSEHIGVPKGTMLVVALYEAFRAAPRQPDERAVRAAASAVAFRTAARTIALAAVTTPPGEWIPCGS